MKKLILIVAVFLFPGLAYAQSEKPWFLDENTTYLWPTNASNYLSATFGETRSRHFHAAIDIGTWGIEGYEVYASRSGYLFRASVSAVGYGNAVYLMHDDGSYTLYAHLMDFAPSIRSIVDSLRFKDYSFEFDEVLIEHEVRFNRGEVIGWSGSTGVGPPHLHVEVRSPTNVVYNPLLVGFSVPDRIPPTFRSLSVEPLAKESSVNNSKEIFTTNATVRNGVFHFGEINTTGPVGLGVNVFDRADGRPNVYAVYELEMSVNGEQYFHSRIDSFSFDHTHQMFLDRVFPILFETRRGFQRLFVRDGNQLPFYTTNDSRGILNLEPGRHTVDIHARDIFGNTSRARAILNVSEPDPIEQKKAFWGDNSNSKPTTDFPDNWIWHQNWVYIPESESPVRIQNEGSFFLQEKHQKEGAATVDLTHAFPLLITTDSHHLRLQRIYPNRKTRLFTEDQRFSVQFQENSVYDTLSVSIGWKANEDSDTLPEFWVLPNIDPIFRPAQIRFMLDEELRATPGLGIYFPLPNRDRWVLASNSRQKEYSLEAEITHFSRFRIKQDTIPPDLSNPQIYQRRDGKWFASVSVTDNLSGVDFKSALFIINDVRGIAEYDPEKDLIIYHHPNFEPKQENTIYFSISDAMGNESRKEITLPHP